MSQRDRAGFAPSLVPTRMRPTQPHTEAGSSLGSRPRHSPRIASPTRCELLHRNPHCQAFRATASAWEHTKSTQANGVNCGQNIRYTAKTELTTTITAKAIRTPRGMYSHAFTKSTVECGSGEMILRFVIYVLRSRDKPVLHYGRPRLPYARGYVRMPHGVWNPPITLIC
jgi:hypothetical protein